MQLKRQRGQTLLEFSIAMPIALFALFAIVYFSRYSVITERAEETLRYGAIGAFDSASGNYSVANIYNNLNSASPTCPSPDPNMVSGGGALPGPTTPPFWQPDSDVGTTTACTSGATGFGGAQFMASHFWATTSVSVDTGLDVPKYLQGALGSSTAPADTAATFIHSAYPAIILWCSTEVRGRVDEAITANVTGYIAPPTPIPDGSTPAPLPPGNNGSCN